MRTLLLLFSVSLLIGTVAGGAEIRVSKSDVLTVVNQRRAAIGVAALRVDRRLANAAQERANDMARRRYFGHTNPDGKTPWDFISEAGYAYSNAAENLASGQRSADELQRSWMRSAPHRANIVNRRFTETGIGIARLGDGIVVVQLFAAPAEER